MTKEQKQRLKQEIYDLKDKTNKLNDFMRTKKFYKLDRLNKSLLYQQYRAMIEYLEVLGYRTEINGIILFDEGEITNE